MINSLINKLKKYRKEYPKRTYFLCFSFIFLITILCFYAMFFLNGKSFIWKEHPKDGLVQHYNALMYYGSYLRNIVKGIVFNHQFSLPMWDFSMGYGSDILATLHYYVIGDPLNLLSIFVTPKFTEYLYMFLIVLRLYLAGIAFSYYSLYMKRGKKATLIAAITYIFCGYVIFASVRHPYFLNPLIYLPLLVLGVEKIFQNKSPRLFIGLITLSAMSNFYFFYMLCLLVFIYALIRYFDIYGIKSLKNIPLLLGKFLMYAIVGIAISSIILIPVVSFFLGTARSEYKIAFDLIYSQPYYLSAIFNFNSYNFSGYWTILCFSAISVFNIIILFMKKRRTTLKVAFIVMSFCVCMPIIGYAFNGFSYLSNRWAFGYSFMVAIVVSWTFDEMLTLSKKEFIYLGVISAIYVGIAMAFEETRNLNFIISAFIMLLLYVVIYFVSQRDKNTYKLKVISFAAILCLCIVSVSVNSYFKYSPDQLNYVKDFVKLNAGYSSIKKTRAKVIKDLNDESFFRYDETNKGKSYLSNAALQQKQHSVSFYYSLGSGYITEFFTEMGNINTLSSLYTGLNYRSYLDALASVKYFISEVGQEQYAPYGYDDQVFTSEKYSVFKSDYFLPLGYTYSTQISKEDYQKLSPLKRQQVLLQSVLIDDNVQLNSKKLDFADRETPYTVVSSHGIQKTSNGFKVTQKGASVTLKFNGEKDSELYLLFDNLIYTATKDKNGNYISGASIRCQSGDVTNNVFVRTKYETYYNGEKDFLLNLGYLSEKRNEIKLEFKNTGDYTCDNLRISHLSMNNFQDQMNERVEDVLENVKFETNQVTGKIDLNADKFLCLSIPYSEGWRLYVDGKEEKLYRANTMYMGVSLQAGTHTIQLIYTTPYLKIGAITSLIGLGMYSAIMIYENKKKRKYLR